MALDLATAVGWLFLAIFAILAIVSILDLVKIIEIRDDTARKWLFRSILGTAVVAVGGLGTAYYDELAGGLKRPADAPSSAAPAAGESTSSPALERRTPSPSPTSSSGAMPPAPSNVSCPSQAPEAFRAWAASELGERPGFACVTQDRYPSCVATLQARTAAETSPTEAGDCGREVEAFRRNEISPVLTRKGSYQVNLENAEVKSRGAATPEDFKRRDYVISEMARMNGAEWDRFVALDRKSLRDLEACSSAAKCALEE